MNNRTIEILISPRGETTVTTKGFAGAECQQASKFIEDALGKRTGEKLTPEFYHTTSQEQQMREGH